MNERCYIYNHGHVIEACPGDSRNMFQHTPTRTGVEKEKKKENKIREW